MNDATFFKFQLTPQTFYAVMELIQYMGMPFHLLQVQNASPLVYLLMIYTLPRSTAWISFVPNTGTISMVPHLLPGYRYWFQLYKLSVLIIDLQLPISYIVNTKNINFHRLIQIHIGLMHPKFMVVALNLLLLFGTPLVSAWYNVRIVDIFVILTFPVFTHHASSWPRIVGYINGGTKSSTDWHQLLSRRSNKLLFCSSVLFCRRFVVIFCVLGCKTSLYIN